VAEETFSDERPTEGEFQAGFECLWGFDVVGGRTPNPAWTDTRQAAEAGSDRLVRHRPERKRSVRRGDLQWLDPDLNAPQ